MSDVAEQQETSLETMQSILERQKHAYLAEGEVSFATRYDRLNAQYKWCAPTSSVLSTP